MAIGKRLKLYLLERNLSQEDLALLSGVTKQTINNIIKGRNAPSGDVLMKIAKEYPDLNLNWLATGKGNMFNGDNSNVLPGIGANEENLLTVTKLKDNVILSQKETILALQETIRSQRELIENLKGSIMTGQAKKENTNN